MFPRQVYCCRAKDCGQDYDALAMRYGFPGPGQHGTMYIRLKERPLDALVRSQKRHRRDRLILSTGARSSESKRRIGHVQPMRRDGVKVWVNPLHDWLKFECLDLIAALGIPRNPVVELIHMSGECLCGAFAEPGELNEIALWYPQTATHIRQLEAAVAAAGIAACKWGERPPTKGRTRRDSAGRVSELCQQCELRFEGDAA
jgi:3'-phosphoadenosine 5'-phosphosulfate sulfotransferase (PAPS reductase)/FAD synthetase